MKPLLNQCADRNEHTMFGSIIEMTHVPHSLNYKMTILSCVIIATWMEMDHSSIIAMLDGKVFCTCLNF